MQCFGITNKRKRCKNEARFLFCRVHFWKNFKIITGIIAGISAFIYYTTHNYEYFSCNKKKADISINSIKPFESSSTFNILIIQCINGNFEDGKKYNLIKNQLISDFINLGNYEKSIKIRVFPENENEYLNDPYSEKELTKIGIEKKASLIFQYEIHDYTNQKQTILTCKWILPRTFDLIPFYDNRSCRFYLFNDITNGEIPYNKYFCPLITTFSSGLFEYSNENYEKSLMFFNKALGYCEGNEMEIIKAILYFKIALCHYKIGVKSKDKKEFEKSLNYFEKVAQIMPESAETDNNIGAITDLIFDDIQTADGHYIKALSQDPDLISAKNNWALLLEKMCGGCKIPCPGCDMAYKLYKECISLCKKNNKPLLFSAHNFASYLENRGKIGCHDKDSSEYYYKLSGSDLPYHQVIKIQKKDNNNKKEAKHPSAIPNTLPLHGDSIVSNYSIADTTPEIFPTNFVYDYDGNKYHYVTIGDQKWMLENLKVTHLRNGEIIPNYKRDKDYKKKWAQINSPACIAYNNDSNKVDEYGYLYNWFAVDNPNLCPQGWHVPTQDEYETLINYLLKNGKLKVNKYYVFIFGVYSLPEKISYVIKFPSGGYINTEGFFDQIIYKGAYWSSSMSDQKQNGKNLIYAFYFYYNYFKCEKKFPRSYGLSVRCIKDN